MLDEDRQLGWDVMSRYAATLCPQPVEKAPDPTALIAMALNAGNLTSPAQAFKMGQELGDATQGLVAALCWVIRNSSRDQHYYHYWYSEVLRKEMPSWCDAKTGQGLRVLVQDAISMGINLRGREPELFLAGLDSILAPESAWARVRLKDEPLTTALAIKSASLAFAGANLDLALKMTSRSPLCAHLTTILLAEMAGAYYGLAELCKRGSPHYMEVAAAAREANEK